MKRDGRRRVLARHSRRAVAVNHLLAIRAVTEHGIDVPGAACHKVLTELNHLNFRVQRLRVVDGVCNLRFVSQDEHVSGRLSCGLLSTDETIRLCERLVNNIIRIDEMFSRVYNSAHDSA